MGGAKLPGLILLLAAVVLLVLVSFGTPLLKNFYFLEGRYDKGDSNFVIRLGTLGYCLTEGGKETCVGPQIGYSFDLNKILGIGLFKIPSAITKYLTYVLVLHIVAMGMAAIAFFIGLFELIPGVTMMCFPTCITSIAGVVTLIVFIFDLAIFYIAKGAITKVAGAQATIGNAVWMTVAAWALLMIGICALGMAACCCCGSTGRGDKERRKKKRRGSADSYEDSYSRRKDSSLRMQALRDEERRKVEQDLPSFTPFEREPLNPYHGEDKYLYDDGTSYYNNNNNNNGYGVQGVGVGYGPRTGGGHNPYAAADPFAAGSSGMGAGAMGAGAMGAAGVAGAGLGAGLNGRRPSAASSSMLTAGNAGVGSGGDGVDRPGQHDYSYNNMYADGQEQFNNNYYDPYAANNGYGASPTYPPVAAAAGVTSPHGYEYQQHQQQLQQQRSGTQNYFSAEPEGYQDPGPRVYHAEDDGALGAIGRAVTSPSGERQYTGSQGFGTAAAPAVSPPAPVQIPTPQRLANANTQNTILFSPDSAYPDSAYPSQHSDSGITLGSGGGPANEPPSYGQATDHAAAAPSSYPNEKAQQRYVVHS